MGMDPYLYQCLQAIYSQLAFLVKNTENLEQLLAKLQEDIEEIKEIKGKDTTHVDKIEYNFDQLKVEKLEGTLNIGITPGGVGGIEELSVNGQSQGEITPPAFPQITDQVDQYLSTEVPDYISQLEEDYQLPIEPDMRVEMVRDLQKQANQRVAVYYKQSMGSPLGQQEMEAQVVDKVKQDIRTALNQFFERRKDNGEGNP